MLFTGTSVVSGGDELVAESSPGFVGGCVRSVCVEVGDASLLNEAEIRDALGLVKRGEARLAAWKSELLVALNRLLSNEEAKRAVGVELLLTDREAKEAVDNAMQLEKLPNTKASLVSGVIGPKQADLIAKTANEGPVDEKLLADAARTQNIADFGRTVREHRNQRDKQAGLSRVERQRMRRSAKIFDDPATGMFNLYGSFDAITGAKIMTALTAKENQLRRKKNNSDDTPQQRRADALAELICEQGTPQGTNLLVIAEVDAIKQQLVNTRLVNNTPITDNELRKLAVDADIIPAVFNTKTRNLWLGRKQRNSTNTQRLALIARDRNCIGCGANPLWCQTHHIKYWSHGGQTNIDNLVLICNQCHNKIHKHNWQIHQHPQTKKHTLHPPPQHPHPHQTPQRK